MKASRVILAFSTVVIIIALTIFCGKPLLSAIVTLAVPSRSVASFNSAAQQPVTVPALAPPGDRVVRIAFSFSPSSLDGYPNIMQTADLNYGVRFELQNHSLVIAYPGPKGLTGHSLSDDIQIGQWYDVECEFQSDGSIRASCSGGKPAQSNEIAAPWLNHILVGQGFNDVRKFQGQIKNFSIR
jgi:hypothetical protein